MDPFGIMTLLWRLREMRQNDRRPLSATLAKRDAALGSLAEFARTSSPFYAEFHKGLAGAPLAELPVLTKSILMEHFDEVLTDRRIRLADVARHLEGPSAET